MHAGQPSAALAAAAATVCEMARHESGQRNYINDQAADLAKKLDQPICTVLDAMMASAKASGNIKLQKEIKKAQKAAGCRRHN